MILGLLERTPGITLNELRARLAQAGLPVGIASFWRFFARRRITLKKSRRMQPSSNGPTS